VVYAAKLVTMPRSLSDKDAAALLSAARTYRSAITVTASRTTDSVQWRTTRGDTLQAAAGDWILHDGTGDKWSVDAAVFADTYASLGGDRYRKTATIQAVRIDEPFTVSTLEGTASGAAGDWLARGPRGECWPIPAEQFSRRYVPA